MNMYNKTSFRLTLMQTAFAGMYLALPTTAAQAGENLMEALTGGKPTVHLRYRYETVDQQNIAKAASASTLRTQLGYLTGDFYGLGAYLQFEDVRAIGSERYNSTTNGKTQYPVVADPDATEINQAYLSYSGLPDTLFKFGRQVINLDNQRFIGSVAFRQNEQSFDAVTVQNKRLPSTLVTYAHVSNVNRIFGANNPTLGDVKMNSDLINVAYSGLKPGKIIGYAYLLDYDAGQPPFPVTASNKSLGVRFDGGYPFAAFKLLYTAEYAQQSAYRDGAATVDADYLNGMLGAEYRGVQVKLNYERLGGDGVYGFATPLATLHAFNGWADRFLATPRDGLDDAFASVGGTAGGFNLLAVYHAFSSDHLGYDYGTEWNFLISKKIRKHLTLSLTYAAYNGSGNATNVARNATAALSSDVDKLWLQADFQF
jgi:hypothetical protein